MTDQLEKEIRLIKRYNSKIASCKDRGIDFRLTVSEFRKILSRKTCAYSGVVLEQIDHTNDHYITVERIDPSKPYTKNNCIAVSKRFNFLKSTFEKNIPTKLMIKFLNNVLKYEKGN